MTNDEIWDLEKRFWLEGLETYEGLMAQECLMAFPRIGVIGADEIVKSLRGAPRWLSVEMSDRHTRRTDSALVILGYTASARRKDSEVYRCFCTSTYWAHDGHWRLVQHQQTSPN